MASVSSLADALSALQPATLQSFYMSQDGLAALQVMFACVDVLVLHFANFFVKLSLADASGFRETNNSQTRSRMVP